MIPRDSDADLAYEVDSLSESYRSAEEDDSDTREHAWIGLLGMGFLAFIAGWAVASYDYSAGFAIAALGIALIIAGFLSRNWAAKQRQDEMDDAKAEEQFHQFEVAQTIQDNTSVRRADREKEIQEIVKQVKSTIKVRCQFCGTLNEENATNCESCGATL